jgi:hypothetical protein
MSHLATAGARRRNYPSVSTEFFRAIEALDSIHFRGDHCGQGRPDSWHTEQVPVHRFTSKLCRDAFFLGFHLLSNRIMQSQLFA